MSHHLHLWPAAGTASAILHLATPSMPLLQTQQSRLGRPRSLEIRSPGALKLEVSPEEYRKHPVHLFDAGCRELLSFRIDTAALARLVAEPELSITAGSAVVRLQGRRMPLVRQVLERIRSGSTEGVGRCR